MDLEPVEISKEAFERTVRLLRQAKTKSDLINSMPETKSLTQQQIIGKLITHYEKQRLVIALGAGVSMGFGLPDWNTLLQKLMITTIEKEQKVSTVLSKLFTTIFSPSPLIAGRYLQQYYDDKKLSFEEAVRKVLYAEINIDRPSALMDEIVSFCVAPGNSPNLDCIISYNFDDILEQRLSKVGVPVAYKSIYGIGMNPDGQLPIYHVHGFLQQKGKLNNQNQITFGESLYHKQYVDIYSWNNIVQINKFRDANCLFIGSSLTDPNTRRLLDIAKQQKGKSTENHFIFKLRYREEFVKNRLQILLDENKELLTEKSMAELKFGDTIKFLINIIQRFEESDASSFGVHTIWIDDWSEIPKILKKVRLRNK